MEPANVLSDVLNALTVPTVPRPSVRVLMKKVFHLHIGWGVGVCGCVEGYSIVTSVMGIGVC